MPTRKMGMALSKARVSVTPDQKMLDDAGTVYPVYIDPGVTARFPPETK